jgi:hypothetical protein
MARGAWQQSKEMQRGSACAGEHWSCHLNPHGRARRPRLFQFPDRPRTAPSRLQEIGFASRAILERGALRSGVKFGTRSRGECGEKLSPVVLVSGFVRSGNRVDAKSTIREAVGRASSASRRRAIVCAAIPLSARLSNKIEQQVEFASRAL